MEQRIIKKMSFFSREITVFYACFILVVAHPVPGRLWLFSRPLATVWGCRVMLWYRYSNQLINSKLRNISKCFSTVRINQLTVVILKGYSDRKGIWSERSYISCWRPPKYFADGQTHLPRPQCQFILVTDHHTPLIMATMAKRAKRAAKQLATRTPSSPSSPRMPCSRLRRFVVDALIQTQLAVAVVFYQKHTGTQTML